MYFILAILAIVGLDQLTKFLVVQHLKPIHTYPIIKDVFHLTYAENDGAAFSIFAGKQLFLVVFTIIMISFLIGLTYRICQYDGQWLAKISMIMIVGGAIGNLIDRMRLNYVIDMFDFRLINFAIFNIADSFVVVGVILLAFVTFFGDVKM